MKVLCYVNHFYGASRQFLGKSSRTGREQRLAIVSECLQSLRGLGDVDLRICGLDGFALVKPDIFFPQVREDPTFLIYESIAHMTRFVDDYDYFINVEDDILVPRETLDNVVEFDRESLPNDIVIPQSPLSR